MALDLKHMREFAFSMTAKQSGESIIALVDEIEQLYTLAQDIAEALESLRNYSKWQIENGSDYHPTLKTATAQAKYVLTKWTEYVLTKWTEFKK